MRRGTVIMPTAIGAAARFRHVVFPGEHSGVAADRYACATSARTSHPLLNADEQAFLAWLFTSCGIDIRGYKPDMLSRRLPACLRAIRSDSVRQAFRLLRTTPSLRRRAISALLIGVTHFFRDPQTFRGLTKHLMHPALLAERRLRIWSAGCSDGPELYSIAIMLAEMGLLGKCDLLGTDCRTDAVERAASGWFDERAIAGVPPELLPRYFTPERRGWRAVDQIRAAVRWRSADVLTVMEPGGWDLVLCRNLAIYLEPEEATLLWRRLEVSLRPGGLLALGKAERPLGARRLASLEPCIYRRNGAADAG